MMPRLVLVVALLFLLPAPAFAQDAGHPLAEGIHLFENEDYAAAHAFFTSALEAGEEEAKAAYYLGRLAAQEEDWDAAAEWLERAVELDAGESDYHSWLGQVYMERIQNVGMFKKASLAKKIQRSLKTAIELNPDNVEAHLALGSFYLYAPGIAGGSTEKALAEANEVVARDPIRGHLFRAEVYSEQEAHDQALEAYQAALAEDPNDAAVLYQTGMAHQTQGQYEQAFELFERTIIADPEAWYGYYQIGRTGVLSGQRLDRAIEALQLYLRDHADPEDDVFPASAHWRMGMLYELKGEPEKARAAYEQALALNPDHDEAKKALKKLK